MANSVIHIAVGITYQNNYDLINNSDDFYKGILEPDKKDSSKTRDEKHYWHTYTEEDNCNKPLRGEVNLYKYASQTKNLNNDYDLGYFIHLITDYYFFKYYINYLDEEIIKPSKREDTNNIKNKIELFNQRLYSSYDTIIQSLTDKYSITDKHYKADSQQDYRQKSNKNIIKNNVFIDTNNPEQLYSFIELLGSLDYYEIFYKLKITNSYQEACKTLDNIYNTNTKHNTNYKGKHIKTLSQKITIKK